MKLWYTVALLHTLAGCAYDEREGWPLTPKEQESLRGVTGRYAEYFPLKAECAAKLQAARVIMADRGTMLDLCWRDEPGRCAAGESLSKYGCAAGCLNVQSTCGFLDHDCDYNYAFVLSERNTLEDYYSVVRHEAVHALGHCHKNYLGTQHTEPFYQIAEGP